MQADEILKEMSETFAERRKFYGDTFSQIGVVMKTLFPDGAILNSDRDHRRYAALVMIAIKLTRYAVNFERGGHQDSVHDMAVYGAILEAIDATE